MATVVSSTSVQVVSNMLQAMPGNGNGPHDQKRAVGVSVSLSLMESGTDVHMMRLLVQVLSVSPPPTLKVASNMLS